MFGVRDLLQAGLKPVARIPVRSEAEVAEMTRGIPYWQLSRLQLELTSQGKLKVRPATPGSFGERMLYMGNVRAEVERAAEVDHDILLGKYRSSLHEDLGNILGFPPCCAKAFADRKSLPRLVLNEVTRAFRRGPRKPEYRHMLLGDLGWNLKPIDPDCNFLAADQFRLPILVHVPCSSECAVSRKQVEEALAALLPDNEKQEVRRILGLGCVVWPDDRMVFFRPLALPGKDGVVPVAAFNEDQHIGIPNQRAPNRVVRADSTEVKDADVSAIRLKKGHLEVQVRHDWQPYVSPEMMKGTPIVVVPRIEESARASAA